MSQHEREAFESSEHYFCGESPADRIVNWAVWKSAWQAALAHANVNEQSQAQQPSEFLSCHHFMQMHEYTDSQGDTWTENSLASSAQDFLSSASKAYDEYMQSQAQQEPIGEVQHYATPANLPAYVNVKWYGKPPKNGAKVYALPPAPEGE